MNNTGQIKVPMEVVIEVLEDNGELMLMGLLASRYLDEVEHDLTVAWSPVSKILDKIIDTESEEAMNLYHEQLQKEISSMQDSDVFLEQQVILSSRNIEAFCQKAIDFAASKLDSVETFEYDIKEEPNLDPGFIHSVLTELFELIEEALIEEFILSILETPVSGHLN